MSTTDKERFNGMPETSEGNTAEAQDAVQNQTANAGSTAPSGSSAAAVQDSAEVTAHDEVAALRARVAELEAQVKELQNLRLRALADLDNYRKRITREMEQLRVQAAGSVIQELLPTIDHLELALEHALDDKHPIVQGVKMVLAQLHEVLKRYGLEPIPAEGLPFDPYLHEAVAHTPSVEHPPDTVLQVMQQGYRLGDMVLRPARVVVSAGNTQAGAAGGTDNINEVSTEDTAK